MPRAHPIASAVYSSGREALELDGQSIAEAADPCGISESGSESEIYLIKLAAFRTRWAEHVRSARVIHPTQEAEGVPANEVASGDLLALSGSGANLNFMRRILRFRPLEVIHRC